MAERVKIAQRYPAPQPVVIDVAAEVRKIEEEDFFRAWTTDADGNRIRVGLTKEENDEFEAIDKRNWESRLDDNAFPWSSVEEMHREKDRWLELHDKHEIARLRRLGEELRDGGKPD